MGKAAGLLIKVLTRKMAKEDERLYALKKDVTEVREIQDIHYAGNLKMDYYVPKDKGMHDVVVLDIHGGAWVYGDKHLNRHFCMHLAKRGFPVFSMNYDVIPYVSVKEQIQEIYQAIHYILDHASEYGVENFRLCLCGDSAGAHLASLAAAIHRDPQLQMRYGVSGEGISIEGLLLQHGIYDLSPMPNSKSFYMRKLYGWMFPDQSLRDVDSVYDLLDEEWNIPMFLLSSAKDTTFSPQTRQLAKRLEEWKLPYEMLFWDEEYDLPHVFHISHPDTKESQQSIDRMAEFLRKL